MALDLFPRDTNLPFPNGNNDTDTVFAGVHFNLTTLKHWNYTYYGNGTISNGSKCWLTFETYQPVFLYNNGSFVNATKCYSAIENIGTRGYVGIGFAVAYGICLVLTITVLAKHGKMYLPQEKRFYPIGRRWQWYWACFVCAAALISLLTNVDVDRYYLQELPITLTVFFWYLMCMGTTALVWEAVRHWGSWQERQFIDPNPFIYRIDDRRAKFEFYLPLWFYLWDWMNFFMVVPRSWTFTQKQHSPEQTVANAIPSATSTRFKIAGFFLVITWITIVVSLRHSIKHYRPRTGGMFRRAVGATRAVPLRFYLIIPLLAVLIAYQIFISFVWKFSIVKYDGVIPAIYGWGYGPPLLIIFIQIIYGIASPNEDKELIRQRCARGEMLDQELGIVHKPAWWRRVRGDHLMSYRDKIARNVKEVGGGRATGRRVEDEMERQVREEAEANARGEGHIELRNMGRKVEYNPRVDRAGVHAFQRQHPLQPTATPYTGRSERRRQERTLEIAAGVIFPNNAVAERAQREAELTQDAPPPPYTDGATRGRDRNGGRPGTAGRSTSTETTNSINQPPQQVRSMLDI